MLYERHANYVWTEVSVVFNPLASPLGTRIMPFYMNLVDIVSCNVPMHTVKFLLYRMSELSKNTSRVCPIQKHNF